ncbi:uncharacterized protein zgc:158701 isoform X1 [Ictalurus furcatus]|uniref:uncharacterized protein zgc:158701 isoform X1 n=1 Tax=Ictalurus furcatus TaxID=66913 RepID=UPI002350D31B|nr:uncharacterized protein zgc:158701 isoform X1 [Ictalurus furcatus]
MKFVMLLLVFTAMVGFSALCQAVIDSEVSDKNVTASSGDAVGPADVTSHTRSTKQRGANCACAGKSKAQRGCQCKMNNFKHGLSPEERVLCLKKGIRNYKKCKSVILKTVKTKEDPKQISIPV